MLKELIVFLIPLLIVQFILLIYTISHIFKHDHYKSLNRGWWLLIVIVGMNYVGPILYFIFGKEDE